MFQSDGQTDRQTDKSFINRRTDPRLQSRELDQDFMLVMVHPHCGFRNRTEWKTTHVLKIG